MVYYFVALLEWARLCLRKLWLVRQGSTFSPSLPLSLWKYMSVLVLRVSEHFTRKQRTMYVLFLDKIFYASKHTFIM